jgi:hypothetical protein
MLIDETFIAGVVRQGSSPGFSWIPRCMVSAASYRSGKPGSDAAAFEGVPPAASHELEELAGHGAR